MSAPELAIEMKALQESMERLRRAVEELTALLGAEQAPQDMAAAGFERYRARLRPREART